MSIFIHNTGYNHTHTKSQITDFPTSLINPTSITIKLNGGSTEGTNLFTYNGSAAKTINITPSGIGAAATSHTHSNLTIEVITNTGSSSSMNTVVYNGGTADSISVAGSEHEHVLITTIGDRRSEATIPNTYSNVFSFQGLKTNTIIGSPSSDTYSYLLGLRGWKDSSGGDSWELAFNNSGIYTRHGASTSWGKWTCLLDSSNYTTYCATTSHSHSQYYDANQSRSANTVLAAPNGSAGGASFRKLVAADLPSHSHSDKMGSVTANGYQGLARSDGDTTDWIRTTTAGIIPYQSGGFGGGHCGLGTESWYFSSAYIDTTHGNLDGCARKLGRNGDNSYPMTFNWSGQGGQPTWLWGGENGTDMYVYNPSNFTVYSARTLTLKGTNTIKNDSTGYDTSTNWAVQNNSIHWYNSALLKNQPSTYGFLFNITIGNGGEAHQMWFTQPGGSIFHRGGNSSDWANSSTWDQLVDTRNSASTIGVEYYSTTHVLRLNNNSIFMDINTTNNCPGIFSTSGGTGVSFLYGSDWHAVCGNQYYITALGTTSNRWSNVYISGSVQSSSDEYLKDIIPNGIDDRYERFFMLLNPILYKWKNNDKRLERLHDRIHCGLGARETERHAIECGLDTMSVAAICKDKLEEPTEDGRTDEYAIAYSELHGLEIHMIQKAYKKISELEEKNQKLETELQELKQLVQQLLNK